MILLLDIGNTRIKWAQLDNTVLGAQSAASHAEDRIKVFDRIGVDDDRPERILVSNVGGEDIGAACSRAFERRWSIKSEFLKSSAHAAGVTNAYREPEKLGVDRWLGVIAAHSMQRGAACVVSVGTAMTIDGVKASGQHLGGVIVPGPELMISSLLRNTSDITERMTEQSLHDGVFADHTFGAVRQGCTHALAALIEKSVEEMTRSSGVRPLLVLTGGASSQLAPLVHEPHEVHPDLVLQGLMRVARGG